ncbi:MAG TPA: universal stress protein [Flavobacterium sp.]|nr:universal stress protein [Flavobacterium sp.]
MEYTIKNILLPTDFSETANNVLKVAIAIAEDNNANLHLLHVIEPLILGKFISINGKIINIQNQLIQNAKEKIAMHATYIEKTTTIKIVTSVNINSVANGVASYEENNDIDLTIIGTHGKSGYYELLAGSNAISIIKKSNVPILSIPPFFNKMKFEKILFPIRIVEGTVEKYEYIKPFLKKDNSKLQILGVYEFEKINEVNELSEKINEVRHLAQYHHLEVSYDLIPCNGIEQRILDKAEESESDLIVINATLDKKWYHLFMGNTFTDEILNNAKIPILSIKPKILINDFQKHLDTWAEENNEYTSLNIRPL